jgi:hypothetical protein
MSSHTKRRAAPSDLPPAGPTTNQKALDINLDSSRYGSFAEIGAGQEVARRFFRVGGAAGTVAKTTSAYDMQVSDAIYGRATRYVSRERLDAMLEREYRLNIERLDATRGRETAFFAFADTVAARSYQGRGDSHAWMGIRFQAQPRDESSQIVLHVRMRDTDALAQHEALGILGVNLVYGASRLSSAPEELMSSLADGLDGRIEIDMIEFSGIEFRRVDNRVMSLHLVGLGLSKAAMFAPTGQVLQPSEVFYKRPVLLQRGRFRPPTRVHADIQRRALDRFAAEECVDADQVVSVVEMTLQELRSAGGLGVSDFVDRIEALAANDQVVMISDYIEHYRVVEYLATLTSAPIGLALGVVSFLDVMRERHYTDLGGGLMEAMGRLFRPGVRALLYPALDPDSGERIEPAKLEAPSGAAKLYEFILERHQILALDGLPDDALRIRSEDVLAAIRADAPDWETQVEPEVAEVIKRRALFGRIG